ncbi:hypothetical protein CH063_13088 [Colletotrichum higginsianum]|nr:hypothetical protein CH063_13088 [Colletotrichum higginsianum]
MPLGAECCSGGGYCDAGKKCHLDGCCPIGKRAPDGRPYNDLEHTTDHEGRPGNTAADVAEDHVCCPGNVI